MLGFGQWKFVAELNLREAHRLRFEVERLRKQRDAQRRANEELRAEIKRLKKPGPKDGTYIQVIGREVSLGGHRIEGVTSVDHAVRPDSLPQTTLVLHGEYSATERRKLEVRSPIDFSKHRPDCPLSWQLTEKAGAQAPLPCTLGMWLEAGWTLEMPRAEGLIEPKI